MIPVKKQITILKWGMLCVFALFLFKNVELASKGTTSILLLLSIILLLYLIVEGGLRLLAHNRKAKNNIRVLTIAVFAGILIGETVLRVSGKYDSYREQKGEFFYNYVYDQPELDKIGLIEIFNESINGANQEYPKKIKGEYRILGIGDSFTEGVGAPSDSTWLKILEARGNTKIGSQRIKTFNAGISGNDPFFEYLLLEENLQECNPDLAIIAINNSDISEVIVRGGMERFQPDSLIVFKEGPWFETLFGMSYICRSFVFEVLQYDWLFLTPTERIKEEEAAMDKIESCLLKFEQLAESENIELLIVFHPMIEEIVSGGFAFDSLIKKLSGKSQLRILNMMNYYQEEGSIRADNVMDYYWENDRHHNSKGYELFAKGVEEKLLEILDREPEVQSY